MELFLSILMQEKKSKTRQKKLNKYFFLLKNTLGFLRKSLCFFYHNRLVIRISNITIALKMAGMSYNLEITKLNVLSFQIHLKLYS